MSETTILKASAINRNAPKSPAQLSGPLPVVQVSMTANGPQTQGGRAPATMPQARIASRPSSSLPVVQVNMTTGGPQVQKRTATAAIAANQWHQPAKSTAAVATNQWHQPASQPTARVVAPRSPQASQELSADQMLLCRHLVNKYLGELRISAPASDTQAESDASTASSAADNLKLAEATIAEIDRVMIARTAAEAEAIVAAAAPVPVAVVPAAVEAAPTSRPVPPRVFVGPRSVQAKASGPRRVARPASGAGPLPMVSVKMNGDLPVVVDVVESSEAPSETIEPPAEAIDESGGA